jgi:hypothetical protein
MKRALVEFEIDLTKMPLGKLSKSQIQQDRNILLIRHNTEYDSQDFSPFLVLFLTDPDPWIYRLNFSKLGSRYLTRAFAS